MKNSIFINFQLRLGKNFKIKYKFRKVVDCKLTTTIGDRLFELLMQLTIGLFINNLNANPIGINLLFGLLILFPR